MKSRLSSADLQPPCRPTFDKWLNTLPSLEATIAATRRERETERKRKREKDVMMGDVTHLLPSGCPGWPSCPTESCWLLPHLSSTLLVSLSLNRNTEQDNKKEKKENENSAVSEDNL